MSSCVAFVRTQELGVIFLTGDSSSNVLPRTASIRQPCSITVCSSQCLATDTRLPTRCRDPFQAGSALIFPKVQLDSFVSLPACSGRQSSMIRTPRLCFQLLFVPPSVVVVCGRMIAASRGVFRPFFLIRLHATTLWTNRPSGFRSSLDSGETRSRDAATSSFNLELKKKAVKLGFPHSEEEEE